MTKEAFVQNIEGYYGEYELVLRKAMVLEIMGEYTESEIDKIFNRLVRTYSGKYKFAPDIAVIEKAVAEYNAELAGRVGGKNLMIGYRDFGKNLNLPGADIPEEERRKVGKQLSELCEKLNQGKVNAKN